MKEKDIVSFTKFKRAQVKLDEGTGDDEDEEKLGILRVHSWEVGMPWLFLEMFAQDAVVMGVGMLGNVERTMEGTGDNSGSSTTSSALTSGRTWEAEVRRIEPLLSVRPRPYFRWL